MRMFIINNDWNQSRLYNDRLAWNKNPPMTINSMAYFTFASSLFVLLEIKLKFIAAQSVHHDYWCNVLIRLPWEIAVQLFIRRAFVSVLKSHRMKCFNVRNRFNKKCCMIEVKKKHFFSSSFRFLQSFISSF